MDKAEVPLMINRYGDFLYTVAHDLFADQASTKLSTAFDSLFIADDMTHALDDVHRVLVQMDDDETYANVHHALRKLPLPMRLTLFDFLAGINEELPVDIETLAEQYDHSRHFFHQQLVTKRHQLQTIPLQVRAKLAQKAVTQQAHNNDEIYFPMKRLLVITCSLVGIIILLLLGHFLYDLNSGEIVPSR